MGQDRTRKVHRRRSLGRIIQANARYDQLMTWSYPGIVLFDDVNAEHWAKRIIRDSNREIITSQTGKAMRKVAFICMHNSCRSQIAEALGKHLRGTDCDFYSAGVETKPQINQDAVRLMKELYGIDMEKTQYSKLISDIPKPDTAISMGLRRGMSLYRQGFRR